MFTGLLAFFGSWVSIFVLLGIAAVAWILLKGAADLVTWFREEILDDPIRRNRAARNGRGPRGKRAGRQGSVS
ncbi:MAG: hypothetical protein ACYC6Y_10105 [Thermoguttaceae bacterium]